MTAGSCLPSKRNPGLRLACLMASVSLLVLGSCSSPSGSGESTGSEGAAETFLSEDITAQIEVLFGTTTTTAPEPEDLPEETPPEEMAVPGVTDDAILFGQSAAFTGPAEELGINMRYGIEAAFAEVNERGGVFGRELRLVSRDDAYEPEAAIVNSQEFIEELNVFALIGAVGPPLQDQPRPLPRRRECPT